MDSVIDDGFTFFLIVLFYYIVNKGLFAGLLYLFLFHSFLGGISNKGY